MSPAFLALRRSAFWQRCQAAVLGAIAITLAANVAFAQTPPPHDKAFWRAIIKQDYAPPANIPVADLVRELSGMLASSDPDLRDDIAYSVLVTWIHVRRIVPVEQRRELLAGWTRNLTQGIGERGTDTVFRRSFSALALGVLVALDNEAPYLTKPEVDGLLTSALVYLRDERDVRGFDPVTGWMHSAAHTADLLKFLARSRHLQPPQQAALLAGIDDKLARTDTPFINGEDERLARAVLSVAARPDFDAAAFRRWTQSMVAAAPDGPPTPATLAAAENRKHVLVSLFAVLSVDARDLGTIRAAREIVRIALGGK